MKLKGSVKNNTPKKKKAKSKASQYKISAGKLSNKKTNRLAKQGKLKPKLTKKDIRERKSQKEQQRNEEKLSHNSGDDGDDSEKDPSSEDEFDPDDTSDFDYLKNASDFADTKLSLEDEGRPKAKKRKRDAESEEEGEEYEQGVRTFSTEEDRTGMKMMLPIISNGKVIKRMVGKDQDEDGSDAEAEIDTVEVKPKKAKEKPVTEKDLERARVEAMTSAQLFAYRQSKIRGRKAKMSALAHSILENPENNMSKLKELRLLLGEMDMGVSLTVRKYAMVSLMEVFKDIVPGYRMRIPTEKETASKVKDETKTLMDYESSFLLNYRIYLEFLETMAKVKRIPPKTFLTKHGINNLDLPLSSAIELGVLAVKCLSEMLVNHPHFNYRSNLIATLVHFTNHGRPDYSSVACDAMKKVFKQDKKGDVILEVVREIGRMVKKKNYDVRPQVLQSFLALKIKEVDFSSVAKKEEKMKRAERMKKFSRKQRKNMKLKEKLDKELLETKATEDKSQILRLHTDIIQCVFETYIRVIKLASDSVLLGPVLEGLAQFAHLINVEYFDSLFAAFHRLVESGTLTTRETLHCLQTAFTILSGQGSVLNIDLTNLYRHLYGALLAVHLGTSDDTTPIVLKSLDVMISKRRKQVSQQRVLAFTKRLCSLSLQQTSDTTMAYLAVVRCFLHTYKHTDVLLDADVQGSGVYLPLLEDPEHCCANSTSLWELHLLRNHYEADVRKYAEHLLKGAPLSGSHQVSMEMSRKSPWEIYNTYNEKEIFPESIPEKCPKKKKYQHHYSGFADCDFEAYTERVLKSVESCEEGEEEGDDANAMDAS